ncbi:putative terminase DNA packaging enzyme small subunit [Salmonella phage pSal-SNUABM-02]|nr:putative terminase DNA packaging enzyme small subunit [Salmonella phage pSal-SNUABM-02]
MSNMSERLLSTLDAIHARDEVAQEVMEKTTPKAGVDYDPDTGEWLGEKPAGYEPVVFPPSLDPEELKSKESKVPDFEDTDATTDYKRIRDTTYAMQEATMFMMGQAAKLATTTEAPRAFTVFKELGELMRGLNKDLMENQKTIKAVTGDREPPPGDETTVEVTTSPDGTTTVNVGKQARSSRDLLKTIEDAKRRADERAAAKSAAKEPAPEEDVIDVQAELQPKEEGEDNGVSESN